MRSGQPKRVKKWADLTPEEQDERAAKWAKEREFSDVRLEVPQIAAFIKETVPATEKLLAEGKIRSPWAEDVAVYRHRRDARAPLPGERWPPLVSELGRGVRQVTKTAEDMDFEEGIGDE